MKRTEIEVGTCYHFKSSEEDFEGIIKLTENKMSMDARGDVVLVIKNGAEWRLRDVSLLANGINKAYPKEKYPEYYL